MSFDSYPSKSEFIRWDPQRLADFLKRRNLTGCDKIVTQFNISGQRFLNMSEIDLQRFPQLHAPLLSKIRQKINKDKSIFLPIPAIRPSHPVPSYPQPQAHSVDNHGDQGWDSEEFSDDDYENPNSNDEGDASGGDYESPAEGSDSDHSYEATPKDVPDNSALICSAKPIGNRDYIDNTRQSGNRDQPPVPPERPGPPPPTMERPSPSLPPMERANLGQHPREERLPKKPCAPLVDRTKKPGVQDRNVPPPGPGREGSTSDTAVLPPRRLPGKDIPPDPARIPKPSVPTPAKIGRSASTVPPARNRTLDNKNEQFESNPSRAFNTFPLQNRVPSPRPSTQARPFQTDRPRQREHEDKPFEMTVSRTVPNDRSGSSRAPQVDSANRQGLDPSWYVGQITRSEAEGRLRRVNRDGAFLVRNSTKQASSQPYTLVVLYQDKVYNIQIRKNEKGFMLGTGLNATEVYESVSEVISHHKLLPLLLIDGKNRESSQQCALIHPAGY